MVSMRLAYIHTPESRSYSRGFTIVELLIVVVIIAIIAAISFIAFSSVQTNAAKAVLQSDLKQASKDLDLAHVRDGSYPGSDTNLSRSEGTHFEYTSSANSYCLTAWSTAAKTNLYISNETGSVQVFSRGI